MSFSPSIQALLDALRYLPGVGPKSAQRMALHLLERDRKGGEELSRALRVAMQKVIHCSRCRNFCEREICEICADPKRTANIICVVESPADVVAIEQSGGYRGCYFVLMGRLSPIEGIGPEEIGLHSLRQLVRDQSIEEVILATNPTAEGEATAYYLTEMLRGAGVRISAIAHGVPLGGELEYVDSSTLAHAVSGRRELKPL